ncbi:MAG TPA: PhoU domain-containing protein [Acidobacteriota bacterium]|jgi:phosphate uptake regulator
MLRALFGEKSTLIDAAFRDLSAMLQQGAKMFDLALASLLDNAELTADLNELDDVVDEGERMIRRTVLEHLSVSPNKQLVASLILVSIVQDAERIGDFARGLAEVIDLAKSPRGGPFADELRAIAGRLRPQFEACEKAFRDDDSALAREVSSEHIRIKSDLDAFTARVADSDLTADMAVVYGGAARILRRISAHISNICSSVSQPYDRLRHGDEEA